MPTTNDSNSGGFWNGVQEVKKKLVTHEDPGHVHKILGIACLVSYIWRMTQVGESDMAFAAYPEWTIPTLIMHASLTLSSFLFKR